MTWTDEQEIMRAKIKVLWETVWDADVNERHINRWLHNFVCCERDAAKDELHALHLLSNFMYFGNLELRGLLYRLYRDLFRYPIIQQLRKDNNGTIDSELLERLFQDELTRTRFLGVGNPSESGVHLLYYLRQETGLPKDIFINTHEIFMRAYPDNATRSEQNKRRAGYRLRDDSVRHYVFIDDLCGSGDQACDYSRDLLEEIRALGGNATLHYYVLFATEQGVNAVREWTEFDRCECVLEFDNSYRVFDSDRYFKPSTRGIDQEYCREMSEHYGSQLCPTAPLGYGNSQLLVGFHHNTPDNTLPIIWSDSPVDSGRRWEPIFRRYSKTYTW